MNYLGSSHVIGVEDAAASADFYLEKLGFARSELDLGPGWEVVEYGGCRVCIGECGDNEDWVPISAIPYHGWFAYIAIDDPEELLRRYRAGGVDIVGEYRDDDAGRWDFTVETPDGHKIMFGRGT